MANDLTPQDIILKVKKKKEQTQSLRDRMDDDFGLLTLKDFHVSKKEGEYEDMTINDPMAESLKVVEMLADAYPKFSIAIINAKQKAERQRISNTERLVYGLSRMADKKLGDYLMPPTQSQLAWHAVNRGWLALRFMLWQEKEGEKDGKVVSDLAVWDPLNTYWWLGKNGLTSACYVYYKSPEATEDEYGINSDTVQTERVGEEELVKVYNYLDDRKEYVIINKEFVKNGKHGLDHLPVYIRPVGERPPIQSEAYPDSALYQGESFFAPNRALYPVRSRVMSYWLTLVAQGVKPTRVIYYTGDTPPELPNSLNVKNSVVFLRKDLEQDTKLLDTPALPQDAYTLLNDIDRMISIGGVPPILHGLGKEGETATGLNILSHAAATVLNPRRKAMEMALEWFASEAIKQFKDGDYTIEQLEGMDKVKKDFSVTVKAADIVADRHIKCELIPDLPQDTLQKAGVTSQMVKEGIWSKQYGRDFMGVEDTDAMQEEVYRETAEETPAIKLRMMADELKESNPKLAQILIDEITKMEQPQEQTGAPNTQGVPGTTPVAANTANLQRPLQIPSQIAEKLQNERMAKLGLVRG